VRELVPIALGLPFGSLLSLIRPSMRVRIGVLLALVLGALATVVSDEFRISWDFLAIDIPGAGLAIAVGNVVVAHLRRSTRVATRPDESLRFVNPD
jgi:hypothetical protein